MAPDLVAGLIVHNEAGRYLRLVLDDLQTYCDLICVVDDASDDVSPDICAGYPRTRVVRNPEHRFWRDESALRMQLWELVTRENPRWVLAIDADEVLEPGFARHRDRYLQQEQFPLLGVQLHELWGCTTHYRVDGMWNPAGKYTPMFVRYRGGYPYRWRNQPLHCGRVPANAPGPLWRGGLRARHFGYADTADHRRKHDLYIRHDPRGLFCPLSHYESILAPPERVRLQPWVD